MYNVHSQLYKQNIAPTGVKHRKLPLLIYNLFKNNGKGEGTKSLFDGHFELFNKLNVISIRNNMS